MNTFEQGAYQDEKKNALDGPHQGQLSGTLEKDPQFYPTQKGGEVALVRLNVKTPGFTFTKGGVEQTVEPKSHFFNARIVGQDAVERMREYAQGDAITVAGSIESYTPQNSKKPIIGLTAFDHHPATREELSDPNQIHLRGEVLGSVYKPNRGNAQLDSVDYAVRAFGKNGTDIAVREFGETAKNIASEREQGTKLELDGRLAMSSFEGRNGKVQMWYIATTPREVTNLTALEASRALEKANENAPELTDEQRASLERETRLLNDAQAYLDRANGMDVTATREARGSRGMDSYTLLQGARDGVIQAHTLGEVAPEAVFEKIQKLVREHNLGIENARNAEMTQEQANALADEYASLQANREPALEPTPTVGSYLYNVASGALLEGETLDGARETIKHDVANIPTQYGATGHPALKGFLAMAESDVVLQEWSRDNDALRRTTMATDDLVNRQPAELTAEQREFIVASIKENAYEMTTSPRGLAALSETDLLNEYMASGAAISDRVGLIEAREMEQEQALDFDHAREPERAQELDHDIEQDLEPALELA